MNIAEARIIIADQARNLPDLPVEMIVDKAMRLEESAVDVPGMKMAGAWWRKAVECVRDDRARALASMRLRRCENHLVCLAVKDVMDAELGTFVVEGD